MDRIPSKPRACVAIFRLVARIGGIFALLVVRGGLVVRVGLCSGFT